MTVHEQFAEELALYALGALEGVDRTSLEKHLQECASCRRELEQLRGDAALLAFTTSGPKPPARAKSRLMDSIAKEPRSTPRKPVRTPLWGILGWVATAAMIVVAVRFWEQNLRLTSMVAELTSDFNHERRVAEILHARDAASYVIKPVAIKSMPPSGKAIYSREQIGLIFVASNLNPLPANKSYELWLVPMQGAPIPAGMFKPDAHGSAMVVDPKGIPPGVEAKAFAITVEPEQGSPAPTTPIIMISGGA